MNYTNYQYDARRTGLLNDLHEGLLNSDASEEQLAAAQFAANELSKSRNDPTYDHHAAGALQYLGILEPAPRDHLPQKANLDSHLTVWGETVGDGRQTDDQSDYGRDQQTDYADERQAISYLINQACTDARMATLRDMMHPQREPGVVDHQNMAEMAHDLKTVVAVVQADMDEHNILSDSSRQQMDYYRRMLTDVEQAHKRGEFERMRRNEAILLQGMIIHFDAACGDGNLDDRRSKTVNEVYQEVIDTKRQAADVEIAMGYRQPDEARYRPNINVDHFGNDLIQKLEEQARYLRGDGVAGGTNYSELRDGINDAREAILDAIDSDGREMNSKKAAAFVLAIQALAENNPAYEQRMIRDLQQKLEAYLAGYRRPTAVIKATVLDQHAMDVLDTINWPGAAYDRKQT